MQSSLSGKSFSGDKGLAKALGLNAAVVFQYIYYWIGHNRMNPRAWQEGNPWMYQSIAQLAECLEVLTPKEVRNAIEKLVDAGYLVKGAFAQHAFDHKSWYRLGPSAFHSQEEQEAWCQRPQNIAADDDDSTKSYETSKKKYDVPLGANRFPVGANRLPGQANRIAPGGKPIEIEKEIGKKRTLAGSTRKRAHEGPDFLEFAPEVRLSQEQHDELIRLHGQTKVTEMLEILSNYKLATGKTYKSDFHALKGWVIKRWEEDQTKRGKSGNSEVVEKNRSQISQALVRHAQKLREWSVKGRFYCHEASGRELSLEMDPPAFANALWGICHD